MNKKEYSKEILGPIFYEFCNSLRIYYESFDKDDTVAFFEARGGLRLKYIFELYMKKNNYISPIDNKEFYGSRVAVAKGCMYNDLEYVANIICREFENNSIRYLFNSVMKDCKLDIPSIILDQPTSKELFLNIYNSNEEYGIEIRKYFKDQGLLLKRYIDELREGKNNILLIDTGWTGNTQAMLIRQFKDINWVGLYFGKWDYRGENPWHFYNVHGLSVEGRRFTKKNKRSCIFLYHHIIESPLEPKMPSTEYYILSENNTVIPNIKFDRKVINPQEGEEIFKGIVSYIDENEGFSYGEIINKSNKVYKTLYKKILFPNKIDVNMLTVDSRGADFGRSDNVNVLLKKYSMLEFKNKIINIKRSLWMQGQIVIEFPILSKIILPLLNIWKYR